MNNTFGNPDIKTASFLLASNIPLVKVIKDNPKKVVFYFSDTKEVKQLLEQYWQDQAVVNPRLLFEKLDYLKDLIFQSNRY